jgi:hypothetical protein
LEETKKVIKYFEAKGKDFVFFLNPGFPALDESQRLAIDAHWEEAKAKNPKIFNGEIYCCNYLQENGVQVVVGLNKSDYKTYKWARDNNIELTGAYTMGNGAILLDPTKNAFIMVERADDLAFDEGKVTSVGGVIDYAEVDMSEFSDYLRKLTAAEVDQELEFTGLGELSLLGVYYDTETMKLEFCYTGTIEGAGIKESENKRIVDVPVGYMGEFLQANKGRVEASSLQHLEHWAPRLDEGTVFTSPEMK